MSWNGDGISRVTAAPASAAASRSLSRTGSPGFNVSVAIPAGGASVAGADGPVAAGAVSVDFTSCFFAQPKAISRITERTTGVHFQKFRLLIPVSFLEIVGVTFEVTMQANPNRKARRKDVSPTDRQPKLF